MSSQALVREFHETFGLPARPRPTVLQTDEAKLRIRLMREELREIEDAFEAIETASGLSVDYGKLYADVAAEVADLLYVTYGTAVQMGFDADVVMAEIHRANMSKLWSQEEVDEAKHAGARISTWQQPDGRYVVQDAGGKILKPPSFQPANKQVALGAHHG